MIQIVKPAAPVVLTTRGPAAVAAFRTLHDESPRAYRSGTRRFEFHSNIYAHADVKAALRAAQHHKCA